MPPEDLEQNVDKPVEAPTKSDVLKPEEAKEVQQGATDMAAERKNFLTGSLGRGLSPSTEVLKDMAMSIYDGAKKMVGLVTGERPKADVPKDAGMKPQDLPTGMMDPGDVSKGIKALADIGMKSQDLPTGLLDPGDISKAMKARDILDPDSMYGSLKAQERPAGQPGDATADVANAIRAEKGIGAAVDKVLGKIKGADATREDSEAAVKALQDNPQVKAERDKLAARANETSDPEQFKKDMADFERRAATQQPPLKPEQVAEFYKQQNELLKSEATKPTDKSQRAEIATDVMHNAAHPESVNQGKHNTCPAAAAESKAYTTNPEQAAKTVTEVATTGKYNTRDGLEVNVPPSCITKDAEARAHTDAADPSAGDRSQASQIFQGTAVNIKYAEQNAKWNKEHPNGPKQDIRYEETSPDPKSKNPATGEQVIDRGKNPPQVLAKGTTGMEGPDLERINYEMTGKHEEGLVISNGDYRRDDNGREFAAGKETTQIHNQKDLEKALNDANGPPSKFPIMMRVHTGNEPFNSESAGPDGKRAGGSGGDAGGWHIVTITGYDKDTGKVKVANQWGPHSDHTQPGKEISVQQLFQATKDAKDFPKAQPGVANAMTGDLPNVAQERGKAPDAPAPKGDHVPPVQPGPEGAKWYDSASKEESQGDQFDPTKPEVLMAPRELVEHPVDTVKQIWNKVTGDEKSEEKGAAAGKAGADAQASPAPKGGDAPKAEQGPKWYDIGSKSGEGQFDPLKPGILEAPRGVVENPEKAARDIWAKVTGDDKAAEKDKNVDKRPPPEKLDLNAERKHLQQAESQIKDPQERKQFEADMKAFEKRAAEAKPPLSQQEVAQTYKEISKLLEAKGDHPTTHADRVKLAENVMKNAAHPTSIDQGQHNTCNVTTVEARTYTQNPSAAAKMVSDVATTGQYTTADGTVVKVPDANIKPDKEAKRQSDGDRNYASQVFQVAAVNIKYATDNAKTDPPGQKRYEQAGPQPHEKNPSPPSGGERVVDYGSKPPKELGKQPGIYTNELVDIQRQITGKNADGSVFQSNQFGKPGDGTTRVSSTEDLQQQLARAKAEGKMPVVVQVYTNHEPFRTDSGHGKAGGSGGAKGGCHVVTVTDYDPATGKCSVDNQWGNKNDHLGKNGIPADQLFKAMQKTDGKTAAASPKEGAPPSETAKETSKETSREASREAPAKKPEEGTAGDRSKDSGTGTLDKAEVTKETIDGKPRVTEYKMPDGQAMKFQYDQKGEPVSVTLPDNNGKPVTYEKKGDKWIDTNTGKQGLEYVDVDKDGNVKIVYGEMDKATKTAENYKVTVGADGSYKKTSDNGTRVYAEVEKDGTVHKYRDINFSNPTDQGTEVRTPTYKDGERTQLSHISELKVGSETKGYEVRDDQGHVTKIDKNDDGTVSVKRGDRTETYKEVRSDGKGGVELVGRMDDGKGGRHAPDKSTVQIKPDGTEVRRSDGKNISEITNSDGEKTTFKKGPAGTQATVTDGQGNVVEKGTKVIDGPGDDGTYKVARGENVVERKADGTEKTFDKQGNKVDTEAEKILDKFKHLTPDQRHNLEQDLADINKLPEDQRKKVYDSLWKIANNDKDPDAKVKLTGQQARELVCSTAHQIAHPESIKQGAHESCAGATMEQHMARNHPERYADMVAKLATQGEYKFPPPSDKTVKAETHGDKLDPKSDAHGQRSYASELFQDAAIARAVQPHEYKSYPPGSPELTPRPPGVKASSDTGERVIANPPPNGTRETRDGQTILKEPIPGTNPPENREWLMRPDGSAVRGFYGMDTESQLKTLKDLAPEDKIGEYKPIKEPKDLEAALKANGGPPMKVGISLDGEQFTGMPKGEAGALAGSHAVTVTQIKDGKVYFENNAGGKDHSYPNGEGVPIKEFTDAMAKGDRGAFVKGYEGKPGAGGKPEGSSGKVDAVEGKSAVQDPGDSARPDSDSALIARRGIREAVENVTGGKERVEQRQALEKAAEEKFKGKPEELEKFKKDMEAFEKRQNGTPPLSNKEIAETYKQVGRILNAPDNPNIPLNAEDRLRIASQVMHHAAEPTSINQGLDPTCNVATVESRTYARDPSKAAELVADVATTGKFRTKDQVDENGKVIPGKEVKVDPGSLKQDPDSVSKLSEAGGQGVRDQASKIFQVAAVNAVWAEHPLTVGGKTYPPGTVEFRQTDPQTGEYQRGCLYDKTKNPPEMIKDAKGVGIADPRIDMDHMTDLSKSITGRKETDVAIEHAGDGNAQKTVKIQSQEDLRKQLTIMKESGQLPVIIRVNENNSPFWGDSGFKSGKLGSEKDGEHVVTITDFDPKTGQVSVDNQRGDGKDHTGGSAISLGDMYLATLPPGDPRIIKTLEKDVQWNREHGTIDTFKQLELLRQKHEGKQLSDAEYQKQVEKTMADAQKRWKDQEGSGKLNPTEKQHAEEQYKKIQENLAKREQSKARTVGTGPQHYRP